MRTGFATSPVVGSFTRSSTSHAPNPRGSAAVVGASNPAARRGRARTLPKCSLDDGSEKSSRRKMMMLATVGILGVLASNAGAEDTTQSQKVGLVDEMKGKVTSRAWDLVDDADFEERGSDSRIGRK